MPAPCPDCNGTGEALGGDKCPTCHGSGRARSNVQRLEKLEHAVTTLARRVFTQPKERER